MRKTIIALLAVLALSGLTLPAVSASTGMPRTPTMGRLVPGTVYGPFDLQFYSSPQPCINSNGSGNQDTVESGCGSDYSFKYITTNSNGHNVYSIFPSGTSHCLRERSNYGVYTEGNSCQFGDFAEYWEQWQDSSGALYWLNEGNPGGDLIAHCLNNGCKMWGGVTSGNYYRFNELFS